MPLNLEMRVAYYKDETVPSLSAVAASKVLTDITDNQEVSDEFTLMAQDVFMKFKRFLKSPTAEADLAAMKSRGQTIDIFALRNLLSLLEGGKLLGDITHIQFGPDHRTIIFDIRKPPSA